MAQASFGYFGLGKEVTEATAVAPTTFIPVKSVNFPIENNFINFREIRGSRDAFLNLDGIVRPSVNFTTAAYPHKGLGYILWGLFGSVAHAVNGPSSTVYKHTFTSGATLPSFSMERSDHKTLGSGNLFQRVAGVKIESVAFSCAVGEDVEATVTGQGLTFPTTPGSKPGAITYPTMDPFIFSGATISVDGTTNNLFKSIDIEMTNTLDRQETLRGSREGYKIFEGGMEATVSATVAFEDQALYTKMQNSSNLTLTVRFEGATIDAPNSMKYQLYMHWPKVKVSNMDIDQAAGEILSADVDFEVSYDTSTNKLMDCWMLDLDSTGGTW